MLTCSDALQVAVRCDTVQKEAFYIAMAVKKDMTCEIIALKNIPTESSTGWQTILQDIRKRGFRQVLMFIADGLSGVKDVVKEEYPKSHFQRCVFHKKGNVLREARTSHKYEMAKDLERIFILEDSDYTLKKAKRKVAAFLSKWKMRYSYLHRKFSDDDMEHYFAYLKFPAKIQRMIYTTNWVERLNKKIRRTEKIRNSFPNVDSALNLIGACLMDAERNYQTHPVTAFKPALKAFVGMFKNG